MGISPVPPQNDHPNEALEIPEPSNDLVLNPAASSTSLEKATAELLAFSSDKGWERHTARMDWWLRRRFKIALFCFVILINIIWTWEIIRTLWHSGMAGSTFRLSDSVLIALVTTSIANFIGLVVIVA